MNSVTSNACFKASSPDYSQAQLIYSGISEYNDVFIAPDNGVIIGSGYGERSLNSYIYFTHISTGVCIKQQGYGDENICNTIPVRKGDRIQILVNLAINNQGIYFVPYK